MTAAVTIGMPVRNGAEYLENAIRSLLSQTERDFILHISDNCSEDATPEICARLAAEDSRIRYVRQERNLGMFGNFDYLLQEARSPFFKWAACDDFLEPNFLAFSLQRLREAPDAVACAVGVRMIDRAGGELRCMLPSPDLASSHAVHRARAATGYQRMAFYGLMRRQSLPADAHVNNFYGADDAFVFAMAIEGRIATTEEILFTYRVLDIPDKQEGEDAHLYRVLQTPRQMFRAMEGSIDRASLSPREKALLRLHIRERELLAAHNAYVGRNILGIHRAVAGRRYGILVLRLLVQLLLSPRLVVAQTRRRVTAMMHR